MARRAVDALAERDRLALLMREEGLTTRRSPWHWTCRPARSGRRCRGRGDAWSKSTRNNSARVREGRMQHLDEGTIHAWLDGALSADEAARAEAHVASCSACADAVAEARGLIAASSRILTALDNVPNVRGAGGARGAGALRGGRFSPRGWFASGLRPSWRSSSPVARSRSCSLDRPSKHPRSISRRSRCAPLRSPQRILPHRRPQPLKSFAPKHRGEWELDTTPCPRRRRLARATLLPLVRRTVLRRRPYCSRPHRLWRRMPPLRVPEPMTACVLQ